MRVILSCIVLGLSFAILQTNAFSLLPGLTGERGREPSIGNVENTAGNTVSISNVLENTLHGGAQVVNGVLPAILEGAGQAIVNAQNAAGAALGDAGKGNQVPAPGAVLGEAGKGIQVASDADGDVVSTGQGSAGNIVQKGQAAVKGALESNGLENTIFEGPQVAEWLLPVAGAVLGEAGKGIQVAPDADEDVVSTGQGSAGNIVQKGQAAVVDASSSALDIALKQEVNPILYGVEQTVDGVRQTAQATLAAAGSLLQTASNAISMVPNTAENALLDGISAITDLAGLVSINSGLEIDAGSLSTN